MGPILRSYTTQFVLQLNTGQTALPQNRIEKLVAQVPPAKKITNRITYYTLDNDGIHRSDATRVRAFRFLKDYERYLSDPKVTHKKMFILEAGKNCYDTPNPNLEHFSQDDRNLFGGFDYSGDSGSIIEIREQIAWDSIRHLSHDLEQIVDEFKRELKKNTLGLKK